jgi:hypothetical protein
MDFWPYQLMHEELRSGPLTRSRQSEADPSCDQLLETQVDVTEAEMAARRLFSQPCVKLTCDVGEAMMRQQ